jgi:hypothetical protein
MATNAARHVEPHESPIAIPCGHQELQIQKGMTITAPAEGADNVAVLKDRAKCVEGNNHAPDGRATPGARSTQ